MAEVQPKLAALPEATAVRSIRRRSVASAPSAASISSSRTLPARPAPPSSRRRRHFSPRHGGRPRSTRGRCITSFNTDTPQYDFDLDRNKAKLLGPQPRRRLRHHAELLGSLYVNNVTLFGHTFQVLLEADDKRGPTRATSRELYTRNANGSMVPLSTLGRLQADVGPGHRSPLQSVRGRGRDHREPGARLQLGPGDRRDAARRPRPAAGFGYEWTGITYQELKAGRSEGWCSRWRWCSCFCFLAAQYESWTMPFMIILAVPLALFGALGAAVDARHGDRHLRRRSASCC